MSSTPGIRPQDAQGRYRPLPALLKKDPAFKSLFATNYLRANIELAMTALEAVPKEEQNISAFTLSLSAKGFDVALLEIVSLGNPLMALMEQDRGPDKVFQFNVQFFPVTC